MKSINLLKQILDGKKNCKITINDSEGNEIITSISICSGVEKSEKNEQMMKLLPKQYVDILQFSDGIELFNYDNIDGIKLLSIKEIEKYTQYSRNTFEEDWLEDIIIFAKIIGEDNYLGFKKNENDYDILDCYFEELPMEWKIISNDLDVFLVEYIRKHGEKYWIS